MDITMKINFFTGVIVHFYFYLLNGDRDQMNALEYTKYMYYTYKVRINI